MSKITIIDSMPGSGKTTFAINKMKDDKNTSYIYITPYLTEVQRIKANVTGRKFYEPNINNIKGSKLQGFKNLILNEKDIASTHALFSSVDEETYELLNSSNYNLILDEVMNIIETINLKKSDFETILNQKLITIEPLTNKIIWMDEHYEGRFEDIKLLAQNNNLYLHSRSEDTHSIILLVWTFPANIFTSFKEVYILTYLFKGQLQRMYYDMFNIDYEYKSVRKINNTFQLIDYIDYNHEDKTELNKLINIYEGNLNDIGKDKYALSSSWLKSSKNRNLLMKLKSNAINYFKHIINSKSKDNMWTTILGESQDSNSKVKTLLSGKGYTKGFVSCNCRATNIYGDKSSIAYLLNRFLNPLDKGFFEDKGVNINEDLWALSELIQFIWRSRIRNGKSINIYIPSNRMRTLLKNYLENTLEQ